MKIEQIFLLNNKNCVSACLLERNEPVALPNRNSRGINPALLTFNEYYEIANKHDEWHDDESYNVTLEQLNSYLPKTDYQKLYRRVKINEIMFEIRLHENGSEWGLGVFNGDTKVAAVQDEWGCLLILAATPYRGFGFGPLLVKLARTIEPDRPSGGFTPGGYKNFIKVYQNMVREALSSGLYHRLVTDGKISLQRVKDIIASAKLPKQKIIPSRNLNSDDSKSWLVYVGKFGDFVIYDRKLKELLENETDQDAYWIDKMIKGFAYVTLHDERESWAMLRQFGGDSPAIKKFLINCAVQFTNQNDTPLWLEPPEIDFIDKRIIERIEGPLLTRGFKSYKVIPTGEDFNVTQFGDVERRWRKSFDRYDEFYHRMLELAHSKYQYP